jgi:hypothetical protein
MAIYSKGANGDAFKWRVIPVGYENFINVRVKKEVVSYL